MKPFYQDNFNTIYNGDCRDMSELPDESVQCVVTSPPYWGLRKYAGDQDLIWGGEKNCPHEWITEQLEAEIRTGKGLAEWSAIHARGGGHKAGVVDKIVATRGFCSLCGAWKGSLGLEPTPELYVQHLIEIMREIKRVLRKDGVFFLNIDDSYFSNPSNQQGRGFGKSGAGTRGAFENIGRQKRVSTNGILKPKDLCLIPFRLAIAAQEDGWWVRSVIHWVKPSAMPESVRDRPSDCVEYILMLTKSARYYYDPIAVAGLDKLDAVSENVVEYNYGNKAMFKVPSHTPTDGILPTEEWQKQRIDLQDLREAQHQEMENNGEGKTIISDDLSEIQSERTRQGETLSISQIGSEQGHTEELPAIREGQISNKEISAITQAKDSAGQIQQHREGQADKQALSSVGEGDSEPGEGCSQEADENKQGLNTNSRRLETNQETIQGSMHLLSSSEATNNGAHNTPQQGGSSYEGECSPCLSQLQQQEREQTQPTQPTRNLRNAWFINPQPYKFAHFAVFPEKLPEICIKAATPEVGCCSKCGAPWARVIKKGFTEHKGKTKTSYLEGTTANRLAKLRQSAREQGREYQNTNETLGWRFTCSCNADKVPSIVLDPFAGSGTTGLVAKKLGRRCVMYELSEEYCQLAVKRNRQMGLL